MKKRGLLAAVLFFWACGDDPAPTSPTNNASNNASNNLSNNANNTNNLTNSNNSNNSNNVSNSNNPNNSNNTVGPNNLNNQDCLVLNPALGACDPLCQTGCGAGEGCVARQDAEDPVFEATCGPTGDRIQDAACDTDADCRTGLMCVGLSGGETVCREYCRTGSDSQPQCAPGYQCRPFQLESRLGVCDIPRDECSVFPNSCGDGRECYDTPNGMRCSVFNEEGQPDQACTQSTECGERFRCVGAGSNPLSCQPICNTEEEVNTCPDGTNCVLMRDANGSPLQWGACL